MTVATPDSREPSRSRDPVESPIDRVAAWSDLVPRGESGFYDTQAWHVATADRTGARSSALVSWDPQAQDQIPRVIIPVYRYPDAPSNPALDPARLFPAGGLDRAAWGPITLLGTTIGYETVPLCQEADDRWWARLAKEVAAEASGTVACLYLNERDALRLAKHLPDAQVLVSQARSVIPIMGRTVPEHLAALTLKQRRKGRKEPERLKLTGRRAYWRSLRPEDVPTYAALQVFTQRKHGGAANPESYKAQFSRYLDSPHLQRSAVIFVVEHDGVPVGYTLAFRHHDALVLRLIGVNYDLARAGEYFSLLAHEPVRYCIEHGLSKVSFGLAAYRQKLMRGATLIPLYSLLLNPPSDWTPAHTRRQNTSEAKNLLRETEGLLAEPELRVLQDLAQTGRVGALGAG
jgi:hypothetical protein